MAVAISTSTEGAIDSYTKLKAALADTLDRTDLNSMLPRFIRLAEVRMTRLILHPQRDTTATVTTEAGVDTLALPAALVRLKTAHIMADPIALLYQVPVSELRASWNSGSGQPQAFALDGLNMVVGPRPDAAYTIALSYTAGIAPLTSTNETNWLLLAHPDAYLYGALVHAEAYLANDERLPLWKSVFDETIAEINAEGNRRRFGATPLRLRNPVVA